jgi:NADH dehydrogenase FAD-containing subunit
MPAPQHVVVVGCGIAGVKVIREAEAKGFKVTVIEPRDRLYVPFGNVRNPAGKDNFEDMLTIPLDRLFKDASRGSSLIRAYATKVDPAAKTVSFARVGADGKPAEGAEAEGSVAYDFLVISTGYNMSPLWKAGASRAEWKAQLATVRTAVRAAASVVVVGGGAVGVEVAGELRVAFPKLSVTLVNSGSTLLTEEAMPAKMKALTLSEAKRAGVKVVLGARVVEGDAELAAKEGVETVVTGVYKADAAGGAVTLTLKPSGKGSGGEAPPPESLSASVVITTGTGKPATAWLKASSPGVPLTARGDIVTDTTLQVKGLANVFAVGDAAATFDPKVGIATDGQVAVVVANIVTLSRAGGKPVAASSLKHNSTSAKPLFMMALPVGPGFGYAMLPGICGKNYVTFVNKIKTASTRGESCLLST